MAIEYSHLELDSEIETFAGFYAPRKEVRLKHDDRELLYIIGQAVVESSCCGSGSFGYAIVPGYLLAWKSKRSEKGLPISEVEPLSDEGTKREIAKLIQESEGVTNIDFW